ncbi:alpha/beta hydrolase [Methylopila henanensis]|uniref:Alpha/beta hydrolase n=1 Tax=Methylopila henanensis TaxID=873516 RepID=A0ABW4K678_9HYPH
MRPRLPSLCAIVLALLCASPADAAGSTVRRSLELPSTALGQPLRYSIYLPDGYEAGARRYPVIYLLHGFGGDEVSFFDDGDLQEVADRLIASGKLPPAILVTPSAKKSWYVDNAATGRWQTALLDDLIDGVDATYRTVNAREGRAIGGYSMGGYGALRFALLEPDRFVAAGSLSGALFPDVKAASDFPAFQLAFFGHAFGPNFDPKAFNAASPWRSLATDAAAAETPALYMSVGNDDIKILLAGNNAFDKALADADIPVVYHVVPGRHDWKLWSSELTPMLSFIGERLKSAPPAPTADPAARIADRVGAAARVEQVGAPATPAAPPPQPAARPAVLPRP